jgi:hypothetical protein
MSELLVPVVQIRDVKPHPNADRLEIACIDGWEGVTPYLSRKGGTENH